MKKQLIGLAFGLSVALVAGFAMTMRSSKQLIEVDRAQQRSKLEQKIKEDVGKPTPIQEGVMTEKQKHHSKIFKRFEGSTGGRKLRDIAAERGDVYVVNMVADGKIIENLDLPQYLTKLTCKASAVVIGTVSNKSSQLLEEGTFTFTDYEIKVSEVLKDNAVAPITRTQLLTYTSPGGAVELKGKVISAVDFRSEPLHVGEQYLLYLTFIPETGSYKGFSNDVEGDTFEIKNGIVTQTSKKPVPLGTKRSTDANQFMSAVRVASYKSCQ